MKRGERRRRARDVQHVADRRDHADDQPACEDRPTDDQNPRGPPAVPAATLSCLSRHLASFEITVRVCVFLPSTSRPPLRSVHDIMNPDTAELAIVETASEPVIPFDAQAAGWPFAPVAPRPRLRLADLLRSLDA